MKIKVKEITPGCFPIAEPKGDLFDVVTAEEVALMGPYAKTLHRKKVERTNAYRDVIFDRQLIPLGFAMEIPKGFKANLLPRSSTFPMWKVMVSNSVGQIDSSYRGDNDQWKLSVVSFGAIKIPKGTKIAQFEIVPSCKANLWQRLKWLFAGRIKFRKVSHLGNADREGFGSTGMTK